MRKSYTDEELILRVWDVEEIKKIMHRRVFYIAGDRRAAELDELWVLEPENKKAASFGRNWGWYTGMDNIRAYYVDAHEKHLAEQMIETGAKEKNVGNIYAHPVTTGLIILANDGNTAKGMWYVIAQETTAKADNSADVRWILEKIAVDFIREGEDWKIWHMMIAMDLNCEAGEDYSKQPVYVNWDRDPIKREFGAPTIAALAHDPAFNWWDNYPPMPEPYETFTTAISYGPEGWKPPTDKGLFAGEGRNFK